MSNLKQVGIAMQFYVNDNDDALPGLIWGAARASYDKNFQPGIDLGPLPTI